MRKTRNFLRRAGSAALALTLTVSLCQPAFAATKAPFSKDETVYAVMAADGSVTKTTVSEHLYNADGLAGVEDKSTLKNIVNTESFAEYTQNGDTLVWNTDDTDVYYKGETDRQLPISAKVTYTLDGRTAPLSELLGQSGHLVLTIDLTNNETGKVTVNGKERTIVTPLVTAVGVVLGDDASNVNAVNGLLESAAKSSVAAFVTLPGVKDSLDGLLPEQVNGVAEYLQDSVTVEADVESLTAPQILLACAASAEALGQGDEVFDLDSLNDLTDGIAALNDAMNQLLNGASQLKAGAAQLAAGSLALLDGANQLDSGLGQLTEGLDTLTSNNAALTSGAQQVADGVTYMQLYNEAVFNTAKETGTLHTYQPFYSADKINGTKAGLNKYLYPNNDWYDLMFKDFSVNQNLNLNIRGGGRKVSYFLNAAVSNENGIIADIEQNPYDVKMNHQKYIFQSNVSANITKTTIVGIKVNAQLEYNTRPIEDIGNLFYYSMRANPVRFPATLPAEEGDTFVRYGNNASWDTGATDLNPLAKLARGYGKRYYSYMTTAFTLDQNLDFFTKGLSANLTASFYNYTYSATYRTATPYYFKVEDGSSLNPDGTANLITNSIGDTGTTYLTSTDGNGGHRRYALQASLNYARKFGKHDVGAMFVYRMNEKKNNIAGTSEENLLPYREQGMAGRVTYGFDNRYLFEASFGYNGSENFAPGKRWGFFPSAAAGWVISNESFWDGIRKTVSNLKIRASYGLAGNDALSERFPYRSIVAMGEESKFYYNWNTQGKGPQITTYGNPNATWEEAKKLDIGLELGLFNALNIEAAYFTEDRTGIFMRRTSLPSSTGLLGVTPYGNIGRVKSHGVDLSAVYNKQFGKDWSLSLRGTFTFSRNEVVEKDEGDLMYDYMSVVGHPVNAITGVLVADGLFTSQEEIDNSPKQQFGNYTVGDIKYRDLNGDGIVDGNDVTTAGSPTVPEIQYGIGATVKWRRLDFSFMFQGASNVSLRMYNMHPFCDASHFGYGITQYIADNHWSEENNRADAAYPRLTSQLSSNNTQSSTFYIHDAKYLRLKTVELGYTIKKFRVYLSGNNLFVISPFDYWDPEKGGGHGLTYPLQRTAKIGVQYQF